VPTALRPFRPVPLPSTRPWAGSRLALAGEHVGELWLAGPDSVVRTAGGDRTLDALAAEHREALVGSRGMALLGPRFPLLAKVIDAGDWLSLQVHPDDALARELYGPDAVGKTEAWLVVDATPGAELVTGPADDVDEAALRAAIAGGSMSLDQCARRPAVPGQALLLRAGTLHAIGAGAFVYELEQPSDLTFRVSDWGRPTGRTLHVIESLRAIDPSLHAEVRGDSFRVAAGDLEVPGFRLEVLDPAGRAPVAREPAGRTLEVVTAIRGSLRLSGDGWTEHLAPNETLVVPASGGPYTIDRVRDAVACVGSLP
jgi:mannose-6-phosphate isomerase